MSNIVLLSYQEYLLEAIDKCRDSVDFNLIYCTNNGNFSRKILQKFNKTYFHDHFDSLKGISTEKMRLPSPELFDDSQKFIPECLLMLERHLPLGLPKPFRVPFQHIQKLFGFWEEYLLKNQVKLIILEEEPHTLSDYICYRVAIFYKIKCLMFSRLPHGYSYVVYDSIEFDAKPIFFPGLETEMQKEEIITYFNLLSRNYSEIEEMQLFDEKPQFGNKLKTTKSIKILNFLKLFLKSISRAWNALFLALINSKKIKHGIFRYCKNKKRFIDLSYALFLIHRSYAILKSISTRKHYEKLTDNSDYKFPFIFFPLHMQPEKTTNPMGGIYDDQEYLIGLLLETIPRDWKVVIKEHKSQYVKRFIRWPFFYKDKNMFNKLKSNNQIVFAPINEDPFKLIDKSKGIATISGTVGIEALFRKKPVLLFGRPWYRFHKSLNYISSKKELIKQVSKIVSIEYSFDEKLETNNKIFVESLKKLSYPGYVGRVSKHYRDDIYGTNSSSFAKIIKLQLIDIKNSTRRK